VCWRHAFSSYLTSPLWAHTFNHTEEATDALLVLAALTCPVREDKTTATGRSRANASVCSGVAIHMGVGGSATIGNSAMRRRAQP
jgi:hypothetical protein